MLLWGSVVAALPFLILCIYWHPVGTHGVDWISNWGGKYDNVSWWAQQVDWYQTTMGRYTSTGLLSTVAYWYTLSAARAVVASMHLLLGGAVCFLLYTLYRKWLPAAVLTLVLLATYLTQLSNPYDSLYRLTGLFIYQTGLIGTLLIAGLLWRHRIIAAIPLVALTVGTNEISLVHTGLLIFAYLAVNRAALRSRRGMSLVAVYLLTAGVALLAPGNFARAALYTEGGGSQVASAALALASGAYLVISWVASTALLPVLVLSTAFSVRTTVTKRQAGWLLAAGAILPIVSVAPVLLATRGDSLPEGITDWLILPVSLLWLLAATGFATASLPRSFTLAVSVFVVAFNLLGGLGIDRRRGDASLGPLDRITVSSPPGQAWLQLLKGEARRYDESVKAQYRSAARCETAPCTVPALVLSPNNFLYDSSYDRRIRAGGDPWFLALVGGEPNLAIVARPAGGE